MRWVGRALTALGVILTAAGLAGVVVNDGSSAAAPAGAPTTTAAAATTARVEPAATTAAPTPASTRATTAAPTTTSTRATTTTTTTTTRPPEPPEAFFAAFGPAFAAGDVEFMVSRLHPLVFMRYDEQACRDRLAAIDVPAYRVEVLRVDPPAPWDWETDGLSTRVDPAITVLISFTNDGTTFVEQEAHVAVVDGTVRWFSDCGTPRG